MRRILILLAIVAVSCAALAALWMFRGREIASFIDRYWTVEIQSAPIQSIRYEGSGTGGILLANDVRPGRSLSVGSTKDNQLHWQAAARFSLSGHLNPHPKILANISLLRRLRAIRLSSPRVTAFSVGQPRLISIS